MCRDTRASACVVQTCQPIGGQLWDAMCNSPLKLCCYAAPAARRCGPMMLDVLLKIKDEQDHTLSLRRSCR